MLYAVISDTHGNLHALRAVLDDAHNADEVLVLGDYFVDYPYPNETADLLRSLGNARIISGNKETMLRKIYRSVLKSECTDAQFASVYWSIREMRPDVLQFYISLPDELRFVSPDGVRFMLEHTGYSVIDKPREQGFSSSFYKKHYAKNLTMHDNFLADVQIRLEGNNVLRERLRGLECDIFLHGHTHLQWYAQVDGITAVNPGSAGQPLDFDTLPAYTLVETAKSGISITERRVCYDLDALIGDVKRSELFRTAEPWTMLGVDMLENACDVSQVFDILRSFPGSEKYSGYYENPYPDDMWHEAIRRLRIMPGYPFTSDTYVL